MILVAGSTGLVGLEICRILSQKDKDFKALVRSSSDPNKVDELKSLGAKIVIGDLKESGSLRSACEGVTEIISTVSSTLSRKEGDSIQSVDLEGQLHLVETAMEAKVKKFVFISFRENSLIDYPLTRAKRAVEQALKNSDMNWTSLQAGYFMEVWLSPALGFDYANGSARIYGEGDNKLSWVSFKDVAKFAVHALYSPIADRATLEIGGPEALSPKEVIKTFEQEKNQEFKTEFVSTNALTEQKENAPDPLQESFSGLMLQYAHGDAMDMKPILAHIHEDLTSVSDYAKMVYG